MTHLMIESATDDEKAKALEAADWLLDAVACATQDRRLLRGEPEYDGVLGEAIFQCGIVACLRSMGVGKR